MFPRTRTASARPRALAVSWFPTLITAVVAALVGSLLLPVAATATPPTHEQIAPLGVTSDDADLLAGASAEITLRTQNPVTGGPGDLYNATGVAILPPGVAYVPGSSPHGDPVQRAWVPNPQQPNVTGIVLIWENVTDLVTGTSVTFPFSVTADDETHPVGSSFTIGGGIYGATDERELPIITIPPSGPPVISPPAGGSGVIAGGSVEQTTTVTPLALSKRVNAAESEIYRGAGRESTFTIEVRNAPASPTESIVVTDLLPATFRLVDCECEPEVVEIDGVVFTRLVWDLGTVGGESARELTYTVRIDETELTLDGATTPGAPTRPSPTGDAVRNTVTATGHYTGKVAKPADAEITAKAETTATVLDLGVVKSVDAGTFTAGGTARFTLHVTGSSITDAAGITLVDVLPDGMCPYVPAGAVVSGVLWPEGCPLPGSSATAGTVGNATMTAVEARADGTFRVTFTIDPLPGTTGPVDVTYRAHFRADYAAGAQTSAGDAFRNTVDVAGTVTPAPGNTVDQGAQDGLNDSAATVSTERVVIDKRAWRNAARTPVTSPADCPADPSAWTDQGDTVAQLDDLVCFRITADIPGGVPVRDAVLTDFVPPGTEVAFTAAGPANTVPMTAVSGADDMWHLGVQQGGQWYAAAGGHLDLILVLRVVSVPLTTPQVAGNLAKLRYVSDTGEVLTARDSVDFTLAPPVPLGVVKEANPTAVTGDQLVTYTIKVSNLGNAAGHTAQGVGRIDVWDALPAGFTCAALISSTPSAASCGQETPASPGFEDRVVVAWTLGQSGRGGALLQPGHTDTITYTLRIPTSVTPGSVHDNLAAVTRYTVPTTDGTTNPPAETVLVPSSPFGEVHGTSNAPGATDDARVTVNPVQVRKAVTTAIEEPGNARGGQATIGELVTYTYSVTIPARTTLYGARLVDTMPANLAAENVSLSSVPSVFTVPTLECPTGPASQITLCPDGTVVFPDTWLNPFQTAITFTVTMHARVVDTAQSKPTHGAERVNTASLTARSSADPGPTATLDSATATVGIVVPTAKVDKSVLTPADGARVQAGDLVTFQIVASNPTAGRPPLHDWVVDDCAPAALEFVSFTAPTGTIAPNTSVTCGSGETGYRWTGGTALQSGAAGSATATMTFRVPDGAVAGDVYRNVVRITGATLPGNGDARTITNSPSEASVTVSTPGVTKTVDKTESVEGENVVWTVTAQIPAKTTLRSVALVDTLGAHLGAAADVVWGTPVCTDGDAAWRDGCADLFLQRADTPASAQTQKTGQLLGDFVAINQVRTISVTLTTKIPVTTQTTPRTITNAAGLEWFLTPQENPQALPTGSEKSEIVTATTNVKHPTVTLSKTSTILEPQPGETFTYRVAATAGAGTNAPTAYDVVVRDVLPEGLVLVSHPDSTQWNAVTRTLSWTIPALAPGATSTTDYSVKLADSATIGGTPLQNTATPASWSSLPEPGGRTYSGTPSTATVTPRFPVVDATKDLVTPVGGQVALGEDATYAIRLRNNGGADASQVDATDVLPKGWAYTPGSARVTLPGGTPVAVEPDANTAAGVTTLSWNDLLPTGTLLVPTREIVITLAAHPTTADALGGIGLSFAQRNTAAATRVLDRTGAPGNASGPYTGTSGSAVARIASADLTVLKTAGAFTAGGTGTWTITVGNDGPDPARGVVVSDVLTELDGVSLVSASGTGWTCTTPDDDALTCRRADAAEELRPGQTWTITVTGSVAADVPKDTVIENTATVRGSTHDPDPTNNTSTPTTTVKTSADLELVKTATPDSVIAGENLTWSIAVTNQGPSDSASAEGSAITVRDPLPAEVTDPTIVSASDSLDCEIADHELVCTATAALPVGETVTVTVRGTVAPSTAAATIVSNTATVTPGGTADPKPTNNAFGTTTPITTDDRVTISKRLVTDEDEPVVVPGETFTYEVTVTGAGPSDSRGVTVTDVLPDDTEFTGVVSGDGWTHTGTVGQSVTFALDRDLAPGVSATFRYTVLLGASVTEDIVNSATAISTTGVPTQPVEVPATTRPEADLGVVWDRERTDVVPGGDAVTLIATVTNHGPSDAHGGTVTFRIPPNLTLVQTPADCRELADAAPVTLVCDVPLQPGETAEFRFEVAAPADLTSSPVLHAVTGMSITDRDPSNDAASTALDPDAKSAIVIDKSVDRDTANAGERVTWTIAVTATGPSDAQHVRITDALPAGLTLTDVPTWRFDDATESAECLAPGVNDFDCLIGTLAAGRSLTVTAETLIASSTPPSTIDNVATATSTTPDVVTGEPIHETGDDSVTTTVASAVTVTKTTVTPIVDAGETATFELAVSNTGVSDAAAPVTVTETLPDGLTLVSAGATGEPTWSCTSADDVTATCVLVDADGIAVSLPAGDKVPVITVVALIASSLAPGTVTNHAAVQSATDPGDDDTSDVEITAHADLHIDKAHAADATLIAGLPFAWVLTVTNDGPSVSVATAEEPILVRDVLPAGITLDADGTDERCVVAGEEDGRQVVQCRQDASLAVEESTAFTIAVTTDQALAGTVHNTAAVTPGVTPLPDDEPRTDDDEVEVIEQANLSVRKATEATSVTAGTQLSWTIAVHNHGPSDSDATADDPIRVVDTLPAGVVFASAVGEGWSCSAGTVTAAGQEVVCTYPVTLPIGAAPVLTLTADVAGSVLASVTNHVAVEPGPTPQPAGSTDDDTDEVTTPVDLSADLAIQKSVHEGFTAGTSGVYRLVVTNAGPSDARGVAITDVLPEGLTFQDGAGDGFGCIADGQTVVCSLDGTIAAGESTELFVRVAADAALTDDVTNVARVTAETPDPAPDNNEDEVTGTVVTEADLQIEKSHAEDAVLAAGEAFDWILAITNAGPSDSIATAATPIVVRDVLPAGITLAPTADASCAVTGHEGDREIVECGITETLVVGAERVITLAVLADQSLSGTVRNVASVTPGVTPLPDTEPREDDDEIAVLERADLSVHKTANAATATAGETFTWTIQVRNHGPADSNATAADPIRITDLLPDGVSLVSAAGAGWTCAAGDPDGERERVECALPTTLAVGDAAPITVTGRVASGVLGELVNDVVVQPGLTEQPEGAGEQDEDSVTTPVETAANLVLTKVVSAGFAAGTSGAYLLTVTNLGPSDARDVQLVDTLPDGLTFDSATGDDWSCTADGQVITCDLAEALASGSTTQVELHVTAAADLEGDIVNRATVSSSTPDLDPPTTTDEAEGTVAAEANVSIVKSSVESATIGERVAFSLAVSNTGPADAKGVVVTDALPAGLVQAQASGDGWTCVVGDGETVTCQRPVVPAGADAPVITVTALVTPAAYPSVRNIATVTAATTDPDPGDDESGVEVVIEPDADLRIAKTQMSELVAGEQATYEITITNVGTTEDPGPITVTDPLPKALTFVSVDVDQDGAACAAEGDLVTCDLAAIPAGGAVTVTVIALVDPKASGEVVNTATVVSPTGTGGEERTDDAAGGVRVPTTPTIPTIPTTGIVIVGLPLAMALVLGGVVLLAVRRQQFARR